MYVLFPFAYPYSVPVISPISNNLPVNGHNQTTTNTFKKVSQALKKSLFKIVNSVQYKVNSDDKINANGEDSLRMQSLQVSHLIRTEVKRCIQSELCH